VDVLAISVVLCILSLVALALLTPSDREFVPALIGFLVSLTTATAAAVGLRRTLRH